MIYKFYIAIWFLFLQVMLVFSQPVDSDIWLFQIKKNDQKIEFKNASNISQHPGYDNQPFFSSDNKFILFTSIREGNQSDIYKYLIKSKKIIKVTSTATSEYSPVITPDGSNISVVMVEKDSTQRIWKFNASDKKEFEPYVESDQQVMIPEVDRVGYYFWLNSDSLLYYKLTAPHSLHIYCISTKKDIFLGNEPTRSFKSCGARKFFYVLKNENQNELRIYDWSIKKSEVAALSEKKNEDFIWIKEYGLMKSAGSKLFFLDEKTKDWMEWGNFSNHGINNITRFAISPDGKWLAVVNNL